MQSFIIKSKVRDFSVNFVEDFSFIEKLKKSPHIVIVGKNVYRLYKDAIFKFFAKENVMVINFDEETKTLTTVISIYQNLLGKSAKKNLTIISFGGGINQDVVGFAASTLYRGVNWVYIPTTLLAMADSAIGLKTSLNFNKYKNVIGTFYPPTEIFINVNFLDTLERVDYQSGVGEIIKLLLMDNNAIGKLDSIVERVNILANKKNKKAISEIIKEVMKIKLSYMKNDEFDLGKRNLLNYGHEFGHALEPASDYNVPHGIAVMIGIIFANFISMRRGLLKKTLYEEINNQLLLPNILSSELTFKKNFFDEKKILGNMKKDKKRTSEKLVLVMPQNNFALMKINDLAVDEIHTGIIELIDRLQLNNL